MPDDRQRRDHVPRQPNSSGSTSSGGGETSQERGNARREMIEAWSKEQKRKKGRK